MSRIVFLLAVTALGCGSDIDEKGAQALWDAIHAQDYPQWGRAPGYDTPQPTVRAHGQRAIVYLNQVMLAAAAGPSIGAWPDGALLVKESFDGDELELVAAMEKQGTSWFFAEWTADGEAKYAGEPEVCINCHSAGGDSVLSVALP